MKPFEQGVLFSSDLVAGTHSPSLNWIALSPDQFPFVTVPAATLTRSGGAS